MFKIKDKLFDIKYAYLDAFIKENQLIFGLQIKATGRDEYLEDENADTSDMFFEEDELFFNSEILLKIGPNKIENWQDIVGQKISWENYPEDEDEPHALFYVYGHYQIYNANIEFKNIDNKIILNVKASCDIYAGDEFSDNLPLEIETEVDFYGIFFGRKAPEVECREKIKKFLNLETLKFVQNKNEISIMVPKDTNMDTNLLVLGNN